MKPRQVETRAFLQGLASELPTEGYLANRHQRIYTLEIREIDARGAWVSLAQPRARAKWVEADQDWQLRFRDSEGVYQADVLSLVPDEDHIRVALPDKLTFLARRRSIRLPADSRNPTTVSFRGGDQRFTGHLIDLSMDGLGIEIPGHEPEDCPLSVDDPVSEIRFELRDNAVSIRFGKIAHKVAADQLCRLGIELVDPENEVIETLHAMIDQWHHSQRASVSPA